MCVKVSIWEPAVNSFSGVDPLPYESVPRVQGMSAPNVFSLFRCRSSLCLWRPFQVVHSLRYVIPHAGAGSPACALSLWSRPGTPYVFRY